MELVRTTALEIGCETHGPPDGVPLVLLHGYPDSARCYDGVLRHLAAENRFRIVVPFLRGYGPTRFLQAATMRSGEQAAIGDDLRELLEALDLRGAILAGMDWGGRAASIVAALWPERVRGLVSCGGYNIQSPADRSTPLEAGQAVRWWYQFYFNSERGRQALRTDPAAIARECWQLWSPLMPIDEADFARTAEAWRNADHAAVVAHSYRHRHGEVDGDGRYADIRQALDRQPRIEVPTIVLDPAEDGVQPIGSDDPSRERFGERYERRYLERTGHFVPREQPARFADAIRDLVARTA